jgi:hypothetical protein
MKDGWFRLTPYDIVLPEETSRNFSETETILFNVIHIPVFLTKKESSMARKQVGKVWK